MVNFAPAFMKQLYPAPGPSAPPRPGSGPAGCRSRRRSCHAAPPQGSRSAPRGRSPTAYPPRPRSRSSHAPPARSARCASPPSRSRAELRIRVSPSRDNPAIVRALAVPLAGRLERLGQHLVQLSVSDVEVRGVEGTTERRLEDRDGLARATDRQQGAAQLKIGPRVAV